MSVHQDDLAVAGVVYLAAGAIPALYVFGILAILNQFVLFPLTGATVGKNMGIRVIHSSGDQLSFGRATLRNLIYYVEFSFGSLPAFASLVMMFADGKGRTIHDRVADSLVVKSS